MYTVSCKEIEPSLGNEHHVKGMNMDDLKRNMRFHLRETHPETNMSDDEMFLIDSRVESEAESEEVLVKD